MHGTIALIHVHVYVYVYICVCPCTSIYFILFYTVDSSPSDDDGLSVGIITTIVILTVLLVLLIIATVITVIIIWSKRWYKYHGGADIKYVNTC